MCDYIYDGEQYYRWCIDSKQQACEHHPATLTMITHPPQPQLPQLTPIHQCSWYVLIVGGTNPLPCYLITTIVVVLMVLLVGGWYSDD